MTDLEAELAEQMTPDADEAPDDSPELSPPGDDGAGVSGVAADAPAPRSQKEIDAMTAKLQAEAERHAKRVQDLMGEDFALLVPSPVDWTPGFIFNVPEMHPTPEAISTLFAILGQSAPVELRNAEDAVGCEHCNALGEVLTGSRKPGQETKPCSSCGGTGWTPKPIAVPAVPAGPTYGASMQNGTVNPNQFPVADRWGRPFGHPHYNLEPASVG